MTAARDTRYIILSVERFPNWRRCDLCPNRSAKTIYLLADHTKPGVSIRVCGWCANDLDPAGMKALRANR